LLVERALDPVRADDPNWPPALERESRNQRR